MRKFLILGTVLALSACGGSATVSENQAVFTLDGTLAGAELAANVYTKLPTCTATVTTACSNPVIVASILNYDNQATAAIAPLVAAAQSGGNVITAAEVEAAQAAVNALTNYLTEQGIK